MRQARSARGTRCRDRRAGRSVRARSASRESDAVRPPCRRRRARFAPCGRPGMGTGGRSRERSSASLMRSSMPPMLRPITIGGGGGVATSTRRWYAYPGLVVIVAHLDLDAFFAAVEELENPELKTKPLVVGGDPHGRGVVATANYEARVFGIHSAMSCAEALRRCPHVVFVRPRHSLYREYSRAVWETVRGVVPTVERTGLDEGYLDLGDVARDFLEARVLAEAVHG